MSDASLPRRCPRSPVSASRRSGENSTSSGGGSHLKPPEPDSFCENETPIRLAPQEDIDDRPPPGRAAQSGPPAAGSSLAEPRQSATSCPRSPPPSPSHGQRVAAPLRGRSPASGGAGGGADAADRETEKERQGLLPETAGRREPPPTLPAPKSARGPPPPSRARRRVQDSGRERRGAGGPGASGARGLSTSRARFRFLCYFPGLPRTLATIASD